MGKNVAGECDICTKILVPFLPEIIDIVSQLKDLPTGVIENSSDVTTNYHDKIKYLTKELQDKERVINILITKLTEVTNKNSKHKEISFPTT